MTTHKADIIVIGGGPAGMMAAGTAAAQGASVILVEKNDRLGVKLLITGKGRCNITHAQDNPRKLADAFGKNGKFLISALSKYTVQDSIDFFNERNVPTKVERGHRIFPVSDKAQDVLDALKSYINNSNVKVFTNSNVNEIAFENNKILSIVTDKNEFIGKNYIICTGGLSYPSTGSNGAGYSWAEKMGHTVTELHPALVPIMTKEKWVGDLQGLGLKNVKIQSFQNNSKKDERFGEVMFTGRGLTGPTVIDMSNKVRELLLNGPVTLVIDLKPALDHKTLDARIQRDFHKFRNKTFKNSLNEIMPKSLVPIVVTLSGIDPMKKVTVITKEERKKILHLMKDFRFEVKGLEGYDRAIITSGGISLKEIDSKTMKSKIVENLYFAGEIIDLDGPTGGFNLQVCWSTGHLSGLSATIL